MQRPIRLLLGPFSLFAALLGGISAEAPAATLKTSPIHIIRVQQEFESSARLGTPIGEIATLYSGGGTLIEAERTKPGATVSGRSLPEGAGIVLDGSEEASKSGRGGAGRGTLWFAGFGDKQPAVRNSKDRPLLTLWVRPSGQAKQPAPSQKTAKAFDADLVAKTVDDEREGGYAWKSLAKSGKIGLRLLVLDRKTPSRVDRGRVFFLVYRGAVDVTAGGRTVSARVDDLVRADAGTRYVLANGGPQYAIVLEFSLPPAQ